MAKYFLGYHSGYEHLKEVFQKLLTSLGLEVDIFDHPDPKSVPQVVQERLEAADGVVVLYGPSKRPSPDAEPVEGARWPREEFIMARTLKKPRVLIVHPRTVLPDSFIVDQTPAHFDFWSAEDFQRNIHHVIQALLDLKKRVESSAGAMTSEMRALIPGYLDLDSVLFQEVANEIVKIKASRDKIIPTKYLFAHAESYKFYRALRKSPEYTMAAEGDLLFSDQSGAIASALVEQMQEHRNLTIVSLGIGIGRKEGALLQKLCARHVSVSVLTVDINPAFIYASLREDNLRELIDHHEVDYKIVVGDFERLDELAPLLPTDSPILYLALGGVFGNQNESSLLESIKRIPHASAYLLMDFQTKASFETINRGGYDSEPNKLFIQKILKVFCDEDVKTENIHAKYYDDLRQLHRERPTAVPNARTIVMVGRTESGQERYVGYSTRYDKKSLRKFLDERGCKVVQEFSYLRHPHTLVFLCKLGEAVAGPASRLRRAAKGTRT